MSQQAWGAKEELEDLYRARWWSQEEDELERDREFDPPWSEEEMFRCGEES